MREPSAGEVGQTVPPVPLFDHRRRVELLQGLMADRGVDAMLLAVGADLPYFTGYEAMASERLTMAVIRPDATPTLVIPHLEVPRVEAEGIVVEGWGETDDPVERVARLCRGAATVAIGDQTWSVFLVRLLGSLPNAVWSPASEITSVLRVRKDPAEIGELRMAAAAADRVLERVADEIGFEGRRETEVATDLARMTIEEGHDTSEFSIVASGPNAASPHHDPGDRVIIRGDLVVCDFGGKAGGYHSDVTRTFSVGDPDPLQREIHAVVAAANEAGRAASRPGVACQEVDRAARRVVVEAGYGEYFMHRTGHGIGLDVHEHPYLVEGNQTLLEEGMTFSVEPGIYLPGRFGVRIEDIVACVGDGADDLNQAPRRLVVVG